jgi:dihydrofolate reductase
VIVVSEFVSLDGVIRTRPVMRTSGSAAGSARSRAARRPTRSSSTRRCARRPLLLGRRSYEFFAARWPSRGGELADRLNSLPKYVVSSTLKDPDWNNSTVLKGDVVNEVSKVKQELNGEIVVYASFQLVRTLIEHDLVDKLRLMIYPVVLGAGERLFGETSDKKPMRVVDTQTVGDGVAFVTYEPARDA